MTGFCPICGKRTNNTFCEEHTKINFEYKDIVVRVCKCKKYFYRNRWLPFETLKLITEKIAKDNIKEKVKVNSLIKGEIEKKDFEVEVNYQGETFVIPGKLIVEQCPICSKEATGSYFVSTLQIRPKDDEILDFVKNLVEKDNQSFISQVITLKEGYNVLLSSNRAALQIGKKIAKSFKGKLKTTRKLFSYDKQKSRDLYRSTVMFRRENQS